MDIHFIYGLINGNGSTAVRLYGERYAMKRHPHPQSYAWLHKNLAENGSFSVTIGNTSINSEMNPVARISNTVATNRETLDIFEHVRQSM
ncbi:hypothetical protein TNCV_4181431 [Trichonephila clavipes]|nr:hypothetical protein TNCV_4181431 [Trichonephila clavipes]